MFTHVMVGTDDLPKALRFYDATFETLGITKVNQMERGAFYADTSAPGGGAFGLVKPANGQAACHANGGTIGFRANDKAIVDAWHAAGLASGGSDEGAPGVRENSPGKQYGAYLRDPDGNKLCAFAPNPGNVA